MGMIKNFEQLATSEGRKIVLELIESGLAAIQAREVLDQGLSLNENKLVIQGQNFDLGKFERVFLLGFGKGSVGVTKLIEEKFGDRLSVGWVIDVEQNVSNGKVKYFVGTHPLPTEQNVEFTKMVVSELEGKLSEKDLVLVVICGGGSALLTLPNCSVEELLKTNKVLLTSGATIGQMNTLRKKLDKVKGGGLAKMLFPATVVSLIFSDVPGNDLSVIASGPTVKDHSTVEEAVNILEKLGSLTEVTIKKEDLVETEKDEKFFQNVHNILMLSNLTAIQAMGRRAQEFGYQVTVHSDRLQGESREVGEKLVNLICEAGKHQIILAGGETTVTVLGNGKGGRNLELVLGAIKRIAEGSTMGVNQLESLRPHSGKEINEDVSELKGVVIASVNTDGWDNSSYAGAIVDQNTVLKIQQEKLKVDDFLKNNDSFSFFEKTKDAIETGRLPCNVSDLMIVLKE